MKTKQISKYIYIFLLVFSFIGICVLFALQRIYFSDFSPINGDFQNYNGYRRLLSGQVPFSDFYYYLGFGPLYMNTALLVFMGNTFTNSLIATNFLTAFFLGLAIWLVAYVNGLTWKNGLTVSVFLLLVAAGYSDSFRIFDFFNDYEFLKYIQPGNSDRMVRAFLPFLMVIIYIYYHKFPHFNKSVKWLSEKPLKRFPYSRTLLFGAFLGIFFSWSNDYGTSVVLAGGLLYLLRGFVYDNVIKVAGGLLFLCLGFLVACFFTVSLLTKGHFPSWLKYNFTGVARDQFWYYGAHDWKVLQFTDLPINFIVIVSFIWIATLITRVCKKSATQNDFIMLFLLLSTLFAGYLYAIGSDKNGLFTPLELIFYVSLLSQIYRFCLIRLHVFTRYTLAIIFIFGTLAFITDKSVAVHASLNEQRGIYIQSIGGYLSTFGEELIDVSEKIGEKEEIFSTYASALDVMEGQFQPSGIDYIIHALGDEYRNKYVQAFRDTNPMYVTTIREDFTQWEIWAKRANWFFYREFLNEYKPLYSTPYSLIWVKESKQHISLDSQITLTQLSDNQLEFKIETDPGITDIIGELSISYESSWNKKRLGGLGLQKIVSVEDNWSSTIPTGGVPTTYNIPPQATDLKVPVKINNGIGYLKLTVFPSDMTSLQITGYRLEQFISDVPRMKLDSLTVENYSDANWENGILRTGNLLLLKNNDINRTSLNNAKFLGTSSGDKIRILEISQPTSEWIHISVEKIIFDEMKYPKKLTIIE